MKKLTTINIDERKKIPSSTRKKVLQRCNNICVCCGQKLTPQTATIDHVVPLSRGGENTIKNYVTLCRQCNQLKSNDIYPPESIFRQFYTEKPDSDKNPLRDVSFDVNDYFERWFDKIYKTYPIHKNPLIAPTSIILYLTPAYWQFDTQRNKKKRKSIEYKYKVELVTNENREDIEKQTGQFIQNIINNTHQLTYADRTRKEPVAIYAISGMNTNSTPNLLISLELDEEHDRLIAYCPYTKYDKATTSFIVEFVIENATSTIASYAHKRLNQVLLFTDDKMNYLMQGVPHAIEQTHNPWIFPCAPVIHEYGEAPGIKDKQGNLEQMHMLVIRLRFNNTNQAKTKRQTDIYDDRTFLTLKQFKENNEDGLSDDEIKKCITYHELHTHMFNVYKKRADGRYKDEENVKKTKQRQPKAQTKRAKKKASLEKQKAKQKKTQTKKKN